MDNEFRISLAGTQEKTALLFWKRRWHVPHGTSATTHILKPEIGEFANGLDLLLSVENEHLCMQIIAALGLPTARTEIKQLAGRNVLVVERFDRYWTADRRVLRVPQEDCCQALSVPTHLKYEADKGPGIRQILELLRGSDDPEADQKLFLKAQIVFWLLAATDGHAKNFSIRLMPGGRFRMTPLYDVMSAQPNADAGQIPRNRLKLAMAVGDDRHYTINSILPRHFLQTARRSGVPDATVQDIFDELLESVPAAIARIEQKLAPTFPKSLSKSIIDGMVGRLKLLESKTARGQAA